MVVTMVEADLLILLTNVAGLYTSNPRRNPEARLVSEVN
jgi:glutamate 5-kinase